jgi:hypothetical protein
MLILANVAIPSIAEHFVAMLILLVPIALIEAIVLWRRHVPKYVDSLALSFRANLRSTIVGLPLGYLCALVGIIPAGLFAGLLPEKTGSVIGIILSNALFHGGTIPTNMDEAGYYLGTLLIMIPYFIITLRVERKHIAKLRQDLDTPELTKTVRIMNDITYGLLLVPIAVAAINAVIRVKTQS